MAQPNSGGPITSTPSVADNNNYDPVDPACGPWRKPQYANPPDSGRGWTWADDIADANSGGWHQV